MIIKHFLLSSSLPLTSLLLSFLLSVQPPFISTNNYKLQEAARTILCTIGFSKNGNKFVTAHGYTNWGTVPGRTFETTQSLLMRVTNPLIFTLPDDKNSYKISTLTSKVKLLLYIYICIYNYRLSSGTGDLTVLSLKIYVPA